MEPDIRKLTHEHNTEMLDILHECPIAAGDFTICFDRAPDIFIMPDARYYRSEYKGFFLDGKLAGFALIGYEKVWVGGKPAAIFHFTDCYIRKEARKQGLIYSSFKSFFENTHDGAECGYAIVMKGNKPAESYIGSRKQGYSFIPYSKVIGELVVRNIVITFKRRAGGFFSVRHAEKDDIKSIAEFLQGDFKDRLFAPYLTEEIFRRNLEKRPGFDIGNYYVAEKDGRIAGVCAAWDTASFKQNRVLEYSLKFKVKKVFYTLLGLVFGFPPLPRTGESFRDVHIFEFAAENRDPEVMKSLLLAVYGEYRKKKYNTIIFGSSSDDPLLAAADPFMTETVVSHIIMGCTREELLEEGAIMTRYPYIDIALL